MQSLKIRPFKPETRIEDHTQITTQETYSPLAQQSKTLILLRFSLDTIQVLALDTNWVLVLDTYWVLVSDTNWVLGFDTHWVLVLIMICPSK